MFVILLFVVLLAAAIHVARSGERTTERMGEITMLWVLVGYCGIPMLLFSVSGLMNPEGLADHLGFPAGGPFQAFAGVAFLAMSILAILTLWFRGVYLIGPAICWAVFFAGATVIHIQDARGHGALTHGGVLHIFAAHGLVSVLLVTALLASGLLRRRT